MGCYSKVKENMYNICFFLEYIKVENEMQAKNRRFSFLGTETA